MNRRAFFRDLILSVVAVPAALKSVGKDRLPYFDGENHFLKTAPFKLEKTHYFVPGVSGNYATVPDPMGFEIKGDIDWVVTMKPARSC